MAAESAEAVLLGPGRLDRLQVGGAGVAGPLPLGLDLVQQHPLAGQLEQLGQQAGRLLVHGPVDRPLGQGQHLAQGPGDAGPLEQLVVAPRAEPAF
jgi:hypothetical protein